MIDCLVSGCPLFASSTRIVIVSHRAVFVVDTHIVASTRSGYVARAALGVDERVIALASVDGEEFG